MTRRATPIDDPIAEGVLRPARAWVGAKKRVYIAIGRPRPDTDPRGDWVCPIFIEGFTRDVTFAHGIGSLDALLNAMTLLRQFFDLNTIAALEPIRRPKSSRTRSRETSCGGAPDAQR